jgi:DNA-directed RNA polymerase subunit RPC12/RpoP
MAHPRLPTVRERYAFCCGYCGVCEADVGGELTVDHFCPVSAGGDDSDENLVYACVRCNQYKGALSRMNGVSCIPCGMTLPRIYEKTRGPDDWRGLLQRGVFTL